MKVRKKKASKRTLIDPASNWRNVIDWCHPDVDPGVLNNLERWNDLVLNTKVDESDTNSENSFQNMILPLAKRVFGKTFDLDFVQVAPMSPPTGILFHMDSFIILTDEEQIDQDAEKWMRKNVNWVNVKL